MSLTKVLCLAGLALLTLQGGCSHPRYYADAEEALGTQGHFDSQGHFAVYYPSEIALDFPGYVVGIEMGERAALLRDGDLVVDNFVHAGSTITRLTDELRFGVQYSGESSTIVQDRLPFISQVLRYTGRSQGVGNCALYNLYQSSLPPLMDFCDGDRRPQIENRANYRSAFASSWGAIDVLKDALRADAASGRYTHLIVAMMGWRTPQEEAIRNFNSIVRTTQLAGKDEFRPLFVGITWVAPWAGRWLDPVIEVVSYGNIAELADRLGLTWVGVLTDEAVMPLAEKLPTTFITHSFGTRSASTAICIGPAIRRNVTSARTPRQGSVDRLIGFEAAFSLQRFKEEPLIFFYEDVYFPNGCGGAKSIVLTASRHDQATKSILWADLAGNFRYFKSFCRSNSGIFVSCTSVDESGSIENEYDASMKVLYLDATKLIRFRAAGTDGGAHSDIFRPPAGRLIWNLISKRPGGAGTAAAGQWSEGSLRLDRSSAILDLAQHIRTALEESRAQPARMYAVSTAGRRRAGRGVAQCRSVRSNTWCAPRRWAIRCTTRCAPGCAAVPSAPARRCRKCSSLRSSACRERPCAKRWHAWPAKGC